MAEYLIGRRGLLKAGAKWTAFAAFCTTVGSTVLSACANPDAGEDGDGYGSGYGEEEFRDPEDTDNEQPDDGDDRGGMTDK